MSSCWTPARSCLPSAIVRPRVARSVRSSGRAIRMTSVLRSAPAAPMLTSFTIQATLSPLTDQRAGKYPLAPAPPIARRSLEQHAFEAHEVTGQEDHHDLPTVI